VSELACKEFPNFRLLLLQTHCQSFEDGVEAQPYDGDQVSDGGAGLHLAVDAEQVVVVTAMLAMMMLVGAAFAAL